MAEDNRGNSKDANNSSESNSGQKARSSNNRNRNNNRRRKKSKNAGANPANKSESKNDSNNSSGTGNNRPHNRNKNKNSRSRYNRNRNRNKSKTPLSKEDAFILKHEDLLERSITARRRYFDEFNRSDPNRVAKLEREFVKAVNQLRDFEDNLTEEQTEFLQKKNSYMKDDRTYSQNHQLEVDGELDPNIKDAQEFKPPHLKTSQEQANYAEDLEETQGSMDDYYKYKGIDPGEKAKSSPEVQASLK